MGCVKSSSLSIGSDIVSSDYTFVQVMRGCYCVLCANRHEPTLISSHANCDLLEVR